jgi:hypothetical protein
MGLFTFARGFAVRVRWGSFDWDLLLGFFREESKEIAERKLSHREGEAEWFYRELGSPAQVGVEVCGDSQWFLEMAERATRWDRRCRLSRDRSYREQPAGAPGR